MQFHKRKRRQRARAPSGVLKKEASLSLRKKQLLCVAGGILLSVMLFLSERSSSFLEEGMRIRRDGYGGAAQTYTVMVEGLSEEEEALELSVAPRTYTKETAEESFSELAEALPTLIRGQNESLQAVRADLLLPKRAETYDGIRLSWYPENPELISYEGKVENADLKEAKETGLRVIMTAGQYKKEYLFSLTLLPKLFTEEEALLKKLQEEIAAADAGSLSKTHLTLPKEVQGKKLSYSSQSSHTPLLLTILGFLAAWLLGMQPKEEALKEKKRREAELLVDYSELVSKLLVYLGAGLSIRSAWERIVEAYEHALLKGETKPRYVYEEMKQSLEALSRGESEASVYPAFGHRCGIKCYVRLATLLEQNRRNGDRSLRSSLELEMQEAFEQRKNTVRRLGEEASTKLMLPLFLSLIAVMIIVMVPALFSLQ